MKTRSTNAKLTASHVLEVATFAVTLPFGWAVAPALDRCGGVTIGRGRGRLEVYAAYVGDRRCGLAVRIL